MTILITLHDRECDTMIRALSLAIDTAKDEDYPPNEIEEYIRLQSMITKEKKSFIETSLETQFRSVKR